MICEKNMVGPGRPQNTIWRMRIACWIPKAPDAHSEYVTFITFPQQQWLRERSPILPFIRTFLAFLKWVQSILRYALNFYIKCSWKSIFDDNRKANVPALIFWTFKDSNSQNNIFSVVVQMEEQYAWLLYGIFLSLLLYKGQFLWHQF